jgi:hypothetical protein
MAPLRRTLTNAAGGSGTGGSSSSGSGNKIKLSQIIFIFVGLMFVMFMLLIHIVVHQQQAQQQGTAGQPHPLYDAPLPQPFVKRPAGSGSSTVSMVEGEKLLKKELRKLMEIQTKQNKCLGIPVESRWKDDGEPIWVCDEIHQSNLGPLPPKVATPDDTDTAEEIIGPDGDDGDLSAAASSAAYFRNAKDLAFPPPNALTESTKQQFQKDGDPDSITVEHPPTSSKVVLEPTYGTHRSTVNAVFAFAQGYDLKTFVGFIQTLLDTGYDGDIVLSVSTVDTLQAGVKEYLEYLVVTKHVPLVVYAVEWKCFKKSGVPVAPNGEADCNLVGMYGDADTGAVLPDPRFRRPLATGRFELYWAWAIQYQPQTLILLMDFRDAYFQRQPFEGIERAAENTSTAGGGGEKPKARLYLYEEHASTPIGKSSFNSQWLRQAYGPQVATAMKEHTVICSGSTIGEQAALEPYLRAMIAQYDATLCKRKGCDQGFHNYMAYNNVLDDIGSNNNHEGEAVAIDVVLVEQGHGAINNLGILRAQKLSELGLYDPTQKLVLNWDKSVSPVVHQFDRDDELKVVMRTRLDELVRDYQQEKSAATS